jgi:hypothetical protein
MSKISKVSNEIKLELKRLLDSNPVFREMIEKKD